MEFNKFCWIPIENGVGLFEEITSYNEHLIKTNRIRPIAKITFEYSDSEHFEVEAHVLKTGREYMSECFNSEDLIDSDTMSDSSQADIILKECRGWIYDRLLEKMDPYDMIKITNNYYEQNFIEYCEKSWKS